MIDGGAIAKSRAAGQNKAAVTGLVLTAIAVGTALLPLLLLSGLSNSATLVYLFAPIPAWPAAFVWVVVALVKASIGVSRAKDQRRQRLAIGGFVSACLSTVLILALNGLLAWLILGPRITFG